MPINHTQTRRAAIRRKIRIGKIAARMPMLAAALLLGAAFDARAQWSGTPPTNPALMQTPGAAATSLTFSWTAAVTSDGLNGYIVHLRELPAAFGSSENRNSFPAGASASGPPVIAGGRLFDSQSQTAVLFTNLEPATTYEARVRAENLFGEHSPWAMSAQVVTATVLPGAPEATLLTHTDNDLALRWGVPADTGSSAITGYKVRWADAAAAEAYLNAGSASGVTADGSADARMYVIDNLTAGTTYQAQVAAVNASGTGEWSEAESMIAPVKSGIKVAVCIHPAGLTPADFDACVEIARNGYSISESAGAQQFQITVFYFQTTADGTVHIINLRASDDPANPLVANTDTDGALPDIRRLSLNSNYVAAQSTTSSAFDITPKSSGDGGRINIRVANLDTDNQPFKNLPANELQGTFLQVVDAGLNLTNTNASGDCPAVNLATPSGLSLDEGGAGKTFCVSLAGDPGETVSVNCSALPNALGEAVTATTPAKVSFTSANWETAQAVTVSAPDNDSTFGAETAHTLRCAATGSIGSAYSNLGKELAITLSDDDVVSTDGAALGISDTLSKNAGAQTVEITATLGGDIVSGEDCTVPTAIGGSAIGDTPLAAVVTGTGMDKMGDYTAFTAPTITIPAGKKSGSVEVEITPDVDGTGSTKSIPFTATATSCGGSDITFTAAEVLIFDTAIGIIRMGACETAADSSGSINGISLEEGDSTATDICVKLDGIDLSSDVSVSVSCAGAADPALFTVTPDARIFTSANHTIEQAFSVTAVDNKLSATNPAPTDTLTCTASADAATGYNGLNAGITVTITDTDATDKVSTDGATLTFTHLGERGENNVTTRATATLGGDIVPATDCTVTLTKKNEVISGTRGDMLAVSGTDHSAFTAPSITIPAGALSGSAEFFFFVLKDGDDDVESIPFSGMSASCANADGAITFADTEILLVDTAPQYTEANDDGTCPATHNDAIDDPLNLTEGESETVCVSLPNDPEEFDGPSPPIGLACSRRTFPPYFHASVGNVGIEELVEITGGASGTWNQGHKVTFTARDDDIAHGDYTETYGCSGTHPTSTAGAFLFFASVTDFAVTDDDSVSTTGKLAADAAAESGGTQMVAVTATLDGTARPAEDCAVTVSIGSGAITGTRADKVAAATTHYSGTLSAPAITIPAGELSGSGTFEITPVVDSDSDIESIPLSATAACGGDGTYQEATSNTVRASTNGSETITFTAAEILIADTGPPTLAAPMPSKGQLALTWSAPAAVGGFTFDGYKIRWANADATASYLNTGGADGLDVPGGKTAAAYTITGLTNSTTYQVEVGATYSAGLKGVQWSTPQQSLAGGKPGAPQLLRSVISDGTLDLSWNAPQDDGGVAITDHRVRWSEGANTNTWIDPPGADGKSTGSSVGTYQLTGLTNGTTYEVQVAAVNAIGAGDWASHQNNPATPPPNAPGDLAITAGVGLLRLSWTKPANDSGDEITEYAVRWAEGAGGSTWVDPPGADGRPTGSTVLSYTLTGLKTATTYEVQIAARNDAGTGAWSASVQGETDAFTADLDGDGAVEWQEAVIIARALAGMRGTALLAGMGASLESLDAEKVFANVQAGALSLDLDLDDSGTTTIADGVMLVRYHLGVESGDGLTEGMTASSKESTVIGNIEKLEPQE